MTILKHFFLKLFSRWHRLSTSITLLPRTNIWFQSSCRHSCHKIWWLALIQIISWEQGRIKINSSLSPCKNASDVSKWNFRRLGGKKKNQEKIWVSQQSGDLEWVSIYWLMWLNMLSSNVPPPFPTASVLSEKHGKGEDQKMKFRIHECKAGFRVYRYEKLSFPNCLLKALTTFLYNFHYCLQFYNKEQHLIYRKQTLLDAKNKFNLHVICMYHLGNLAFTKM